MSFPVVNLLQNSYFEISISYIRVFCGFELSCCRIIGGDIFSWFFMFLVSLCRCFCIWSSRPLLKSLLVAFRWYWSLVLLYEGFPWFLNGWTSSTLLVQPCGGTLMFLLVPRAHRSGCWKSLFCFLEGSVIHSSNCSCSLTCTPWSTLLQILPTTGLALTATTLKGMPQNGRGCGFSTWGVGDAYRPSREIPEWGTPRDSWADSLLKSWSSLQEPCSFHALDILTCFLHLLFPSFHHGSPTSGLLVPLCDPNS